MLLAPRARRLLSASPPGSLPTPAVSADAGEQYLSLPSPRRPRRSRAAVGAAAARFSPSCYCSLRGPAAGGASRGWGEAAGAEEGRAHGGSISRPPRASFPVAGLPAPARAALANAAANAAAANAGPADAANAAAAAAALRLSIAVTASAAAAAAGS
ncbi:antifreeze protein Maxi-like [Petaurus breviceps papuanus]|uniref:antifreeze protein Maxi-like n=1 Tax=Petaurus breviceps papuanus TaxID=3040969 RepID=UPI0036DC564B